MQCGGSTWIVGPSSLVHVILADTPYPLLVVPLCIPALTVFEFAFKDDQLDWTRKGPFSQTPNGKKVEMVKSGLVEHRQVSLRAIRFDPNNVRNITEIKVIGGH